MDLHILDLAIGCLVTLMVSGIYKGVQTFIKSRVHVSCPQAKGVAALEVISRDLAKAVNVLLEVQGPQTESLIALLEATQGQCNGNVNAALEKARKSKKKFDDYQVGQLKIGA